ncbi:unnamed protein product [Albugo candida]|uniref:Uncharacterized protein n=1 Tax=Albugo candida TaxID=65357 RepID=A0A024FWV1_9STRA|nr:unnamed protein product [Albugo candida]|eukprot:CCI11139.1 unnamed protein product [Albugo candida]
MTRLYLVGLLGIGAAGMHIKYNQIGRLPLLIKPLELYKDKDPVLSAVKYVENKDKLIEAIKEYTMTYERIILDQVDFFFKTDADASKFWKDLTFLPVEPHSIQVFLRDKPSHFLADKFPSYLVVFYSHTAWNELYNTVKPSPKTVDLDPSNLRSIISELSNSKENKTDNFAPRAIDYFTKGLEGKHFILTLKILTKSLEAI